MPYKQVHFACQHETKNILTLDTVPDFHPLSLREIEHLLKHARQNGNFQTRNSIKIRLCQAIPGYECPRPIEGIIVLREVQISRLYVDYVEQGFKISPRQLARKIHATMHVVVDE